MTEQLIDAHPWPSVLDVRGRGIVLQSEARGRADDRERGRELMSDNGRELLQQRRRRSEIRLLGRVGQVRGC